MPGLQLILSLRLYHFYQMIQHFVDCYNANPASMKDSIEYFSGQCRGLPKLFVLGGMEELGEEGPLLHRKVASAISVEENDVFILLGEKASWMAEGLLEGGAKEEQVMVLSDLEDARPFVEDFDGAVLFKGSRLNELEQLLPAWAVDQETLEAPAGC